MPDALPISGGFDTQMNANARDMAALFASIDRMVAQSTSAFAAMQANFGTGNDRAMGRTVLAANNGRPLAGGGDPLAGQTTSTTLRQVAAASFARMTASLPPGLPGLTPTSPVAANASAGAPAASRGGGNSGGGVPGEGAAAAAAAATAGGAAGGGGGAGAGGGGGAGGAGGGAGAGGGGGGGAGGAGGGGAGGGAGAGGADAGRATGGTATRNWLGNNIGMLGIIGGPVGIAATALSVANKGVDEWHSQSAKNDYYRNIEGGTVGNAMGERLREEKYAWNTMGVFSGEEAKQAYQGVTRMGYTNRTDARNQGASRHDALDYISQAKQSRGQSVDEGLAQVSEASKSLNMNLDSLQTAMEAVGESAGKAGVNTEMARTQMLALMKIGISQGQGGGAIGIAQAMEQNNASYGKAYASGVDSSKMYSQSNLYRMASMSNLSPGALNNLKRHDSVAYAKVAAKLDQHAMSSAGITPDMQAELRAAFKAAGPAGLTPEGIKDIASKFQDDHPELNPGVVTNVMSTLGNTDYQGNSELAFQGIAGLAGGKNVGEAAAKVQTSVGKTDLKGNALGGDKESGKGSKNAGVSSSLEKFGELTTTKWYNSSVGKTDQSLAAQEYIKSSRKSGKRDPIIEALLQNKDLMGDKGDQTNVKVHTKDGDRVLSLKEAVMQFPEEMAKGEVEFMNGDVGGKTVQDLTGGKIDTQRDTKGEKGKSTTSGSTVSNWNKTHDASEQGGGENGVMLDLSPAAKAWFVKVSDPSSGSVFPPAPGSDGDRTSPP